MSKVSVIIPVYNCNPIFIQQAIDSILSQTYKNLELIIVNDGSTNNETLEYLRNIDTNKIKLFNQKNQGAAIARLTGFKHSTGDYISFIDADDWLDNNYYKTLINLCEKHSADIACATLCRVENYNQFDMDKFDNVVVSDFVEKMQFVTNGSISSKLFKRSLFSLLKFHIKKRYWEDNPVLVEAFLKSNNVVFTNTVRYYYRENPKSTCKDPSKLYKRQIDGLYVLNEIYKIVKDEKKYIQKIAIDKFSFLRNQETYSNPQEYKKNAKQILNKELFEYFRTGILNSSLENITNICSGCSACVNICPSKAISMLENQEGFLYPNIDREKCTHCGLCDKICPVINPKYNNIQTPICYAVMANDNIRLNGCSSGGIFPVLAKYYLDKGWYVSGAKFLEDGSLRHIVTNNIEELKNLVGSKYLQSSIDNTYSHIKELLNNNQNVLFVGTPCQVAGLKAFLQKDYTNLLTIDIVCHGVPSPKVFKKYINEEILDTQDEKWLNTNFRDKVNGWNPYLITTTTTTKFVSTGTDENLFMQAFLGNYCLRESCSDCKFAQFPRQGDITIGDFWGIDNYNSKLNDQKGTSLLLINSEKGSNLINEIKSELKLFEEVPLTVALEGNWNLAHSSIPSDNRKLFFELLDKKTLKENLKICKEDKCDFLIVNFTWGLNYGANITGWAMQELVKSFGLVPKVLNAKSNYIKSIYKNSFAENFSKRFIDFTKDIDNDKLSEYASKCKGVIVGSDQVFRLEYLETFDKYFLNFLSLFNKKIAIAPSFGIERDEFLSYEGLTEEKLYDVSRSLHSFDYLSCRELSGKEIYKDVFGLESDMILDPVFLIDKDKYNNIIETSNKNYKCKIVSYVLDDNDDYDNVYKHIEQKFNIPIVKIQDGYKDKNSLDVSDWVKAFYDAEFIITDSYHGVCLSLIFHKPFICIKNKYRGTARFDSIIEMFDIEDNFVSSITDVITKSLTLDMDYRAIDKILEKEKKRCIEILKEVLLNDYSNNKNAKLGKVVNYTSNKLVTDITLINAKIDEVNNNYNNLFLCLNRNKIYRKYYRYKITNLLLFSKNKHYYNKYNEYKAYIRKIRKIVKGLK